jgi:AcrR family transcriptional regulator
MKTQDSARPQAGEAAGEPPPGVSARLFPAAIKAFAERDFQHVGMRDIAVASGVSTATIYKYFASKEMLLFALLRRELAAIDRELSDAIEKANSHEDKWRACFSELFRHYDQKPDLAVVYFITVPTKTWITDGSWSTFGSVERLGRLVLEGRALGLLDTSISVSMATSLVFMHCAREVQLWYYHGRRWNLRDRAERVFQVFRKTLFAVP